MQNRSSRAKGPKKSIKRDRTKPQPVQWLNLVRKGTKHANTTTHAVVLEFEKVYSVPPLPPLSPQSANHLAQQLRNHAASTPHDPAVFFQDVTRRRANVEKLLDKIDDCKSRATAAENAPDENLAKDLITQAKESFDGITRELNGMIGDTLRHLESQDFPSRADDLKDNIAYCHERHAECCRQYGNTLLAICKTTKNPTLYLQLCQAAYNVFRTSLTAIDKAISELEGRNRLLKQLDFKNQRTSCVACVIRGAGEMRDFHAHQFSTTNRWDVKASAAGPMVKCMQITANHAIELLPPNEHEELHSYLSDTLDDCSAAAETFIDIARHSMKGKIAVDGKQFLSLLANARSHADLMQVWASKLLGHIQKTGSGERKTDAYRSKASASNLTLMTRDKIIAKRSAATAIFIESSATQAWYERQHIVRGLAAAEYGGNPDMHQCAKEWLDEFNKRSLVLEGTLLTQLIPMLKKHHTDGQMDTPSYRILDSAVQNFLALEQEASDMASFCRAHGFSENIAQAHDTLANQKSQVCDMLKGDLKKLKDRHDLIEASSATKKPADSASSTGKKKKGKTRMTNAAVAAAAAAKQKQKQKTQPAGTSDAQAPVAPDEPEDVAMEVFETSMEGTLAGRREGAVIIVDNDFTGTPVSYRQRDDGLWIRSEDTQDVEPVALTGGAKIVAKASALEAKADEFTKHLNHDSDGFSLAHFWHKRAMQAQYGAVSYLKERIAYMKESKLAPQEIAIVEQHLTHAEDRSNTIEQGLLEVTRKRPQLTDSSLNYLLDRLPETKVKKVVSRKPLAGNTKIARTGIQADFMDEYQIEFPNRNRPRGDAARQMHSLHVHYDRPQAELDKFTACHLKYGADEEPIRNKVGSHLLEKIAGRANVPK